MHEAAFSQAARPAPAIVLGLEMRPFSIGHAVILIREENPLSGLQEKPALPSFEQLVFAAWTCASSWRESLTTARDPLLRLKMWIWKQRIRRMQAGFLRACAGLPGAEEIFLNQEVARFVQYRRIGCQEFPLADTLRTDREYKRPNGAPFLLRLHQFLQVVLHVSEERAWDYSVSLAAMHWEAYQEEAGTMEIKNQFDYEFEKFVAEQEALGAKGLLGESGRLGEASLPGASLPGKEAACRV